MEMNAFLVRGLVALNAISVIFTSMVEHSAFLVNSQRLTRNAANAQLAAFTLLPDPPAKSALWHHHPNAPNKIVLDLATSMVPVNVQVRSLLNPNASNIRTSAIQVSVANTASEAVSI